MKLKTQIIFSIFFTAYLAIVLLTNISLTGFWTDIIFSIFLSFFALGIVFKNNTDKIWLKIILKTTNISCTLIVIGLLGINLINPINWDTFKLRSFYYQSVNGRLFNAYFKPVGAYSGGYGYFWLSETSKYFPIIEWRVYSENAVNHDFNINKLDGQTINNYEIVRNYIKCEIIDKQK